MQAQTLVTLFIPFTIMMVMFAMGLSLKRSDFGLVFEEPRAVFLGSFSQLILLPLIGFGVATLFASTPEQAVGLVLVASCPGGPSSNLMTRLIKGDLALSVSLTAISGVITMISIPLYSGLAASVFAPELPDLSLPISDTIIKLTLIMGVPLFLGMITLSKSPRVAQRLEPIMEKSSVILMVILIIGALVKSRRELAEYGWAEVTPPMLLSLLGMSFGLILSMACRLKPAQRMTIPLEVGAQNAALAIGLALSSLHNQHVAFPAVVYGTFMYLPCGLMMFWGRNYLRRHTEAQHLCC